MSVDIQKLCQDLEEVLEKARADDVTGIIVAVGLGTDDGLDSHIIASGYLSRHMGFTLGVNIVAALKNNLPTSSTPPEDAELLPMPEPLEVTQ